LEVQILSAVNIKATLFTKLYTTLYFLVIVYQEWGDRVTYDSCFFLVVGVSRVDILVLLGF
jgi:hypothetical protein